MMTAMIRTAFQTWQTQTNPGAPPGNSNNNQFQGSPESVPTHIKEWNAEEIGYFDPKYEETGPMITVEKSVFYRDVFSFIDRLQDMAVVRGHDKMRIVLSQCLRGAALI